MRLEKFFFYRARQKNVCTLLN
uniref:Uncharacterized protein n=1 Tax=Anguilla anguilla TaxID=7936 RepID=A0A0E9QY13_ANGAN